MNQSPGYEPNHFATIVEALTDTGWCVIRDFLPRNTVAALAEECLALHRAGHYKRAGIGKDGGSQVRDDIRGDHVLWLDEQNASPTQGQYLQVLEELRQSINSALYLGLFEFEGHFAVYPPGTFYKKHLDQFRGVEARTVTCVFYLNQGWSPADGGQLRFYLNGQSETEYVDILPEAGTLACFLSGRFYHEVLPARRERMAVTGWFRRRE